VNGVASGKGRRHEKKRAAGGVLTAKQASHRPGTAPALGLRAGSMFLNCTADRIHGRDPRSCPMKRTPGVLVAAGIVGGAAWCLMSLAYIATPTEGLDSYAAPARVSDWHQKIAESQELDDDLKRSMRRLEAKEAIVAELIGDRLTLLEAAAQFRDLNATW